MMVAMPYLTGIALGPDKSTNRGVHLRGWGRAQGPAWTRAGGIYGPGWNMQWNAVYEPTLNEGLGLICIDRELKQQPGRLFRRFEPAGMSVLHYPSVELDPGEAMTVMPAELLVHEGNWRVVGKEYRSQISSYIHARRSPEWFRLYPAGSWLNFPDPVVTTALKERGENPTFAKLMPKRAAATFYRTQGYGWQQEFMADGHFSTYHGEYDRIREDLGGVVSFREGVAAAKKLGRKPFVTVATVSVHPAANWLKGKKPQNYWLMDHPFPSSFPGDTKYRNFFADVRYEPYQDHFSAMIGRLVASTGLDGIYLDEGGGDYYGPNYNPSLAPRSPFALGEKYPGIAFHRKLRAAVDAANPGAVITSENKNEMTLPFLDGAHHNTHPDREIQPFRLVYPRFGSECLLGAIPALLNNLGSIVRDTIAYQWKVGFGDAHQESIKGKGSQAPRPAVLAGMTDDEIARRTPSYRYAELRPTLRDWVLHGDVTNEDPVAMVDDARTDEFVARLWKAPRYWLLTAGHFAGWEQETPVVFKLPELPDDIVSALEFDLENLTVTPAPIDRSDRGIFVTVHHGFSAVILAKPDCPPLIEWDFDDSEILRAGESAAVRLTPNVRQLQVTCPGLIVTKVGSGEFRIGVPEEALSGYYYFEAKSPDAMPLWRALRVTGN